MLNDAVFPAFQRALVIGCSGAGKSTFARGLATATGIPVVHLDQLFWEPGWEMASKSTYKARLEAALAGDRWIIDGSYPSTPDQRLPRADAVFWLDLPRWRCLARVIRRVVGTYGQVRPDMTAGCPEQFDVAFLRYVWHFQRKYNLGMEAVIQRQGKSSITHRFSSDREAQACLAAYGLK